MARFTVREIEGMRQMRIDLDGGAVRSVRGALSRLEGDVQMTVPLPGPGTLLRTMLSREAAVRPRYAGRGAVFLAPSIKGFHVFTTGGDRWILEPGVFWASDASVELGLRLERMLPSMWAGDGLIKFQTTVAGSGQIAVNTPGPVEEVTVAEGEILAKGRIVLGWTEGLRFSVKRPGGYLRSVLAGEPRARAYRGSGRALVCWTPYWNQYIHDMMARDSLPTDALLT